MANYESVHDHRVFKADSPLDLINASRAPAPALNLGTPELTAHMAIWPPRPQGRTIRVDTPEIWLADSIDSGAIKVLAPAPDQVKDEWKECRSTIDRFDKILVDLRKTGFGFVTAIVSGATFFFVPDKTKPVLDSTKFAVFTIIMVLTFTLYVVDRVHQVWLQEAVDRARDLETKLGFQISTILGSRYTRRHAIWLGAALYFMLAGAVYMAFVFASDAPWGRGTYQWLMAIELIVGLALVDVVSLWGR
jgi:hypothetical protein